MTERDYATAQERASHIEQEISEEIDKEWMNELPLESEGNLWRKQTEVTNKLLIRVVVLLEGITGDIADERQNQLEARRAAR